MADYITLAEFKDNSELVGFSFADYGAQMAITAASNGITEYCGRRFDLSSSGSVTRYYSPSDPLVLNIDDITCTSFGATVQVDVDGDGVFETTWTRNIDYVLEPLNAEADGNPYETLRRNTHSGQRFPGWQRSVQVTGQFGWPTVPAQVKQATTVMATRLLKRAREAPFGIVGLNAVDANPIRISRVDPDVAFLLDNLIRGQGVLIG